ncbi:MAG TPA: TldD/PmbA family protein, partial [Acidimicrobiia bacterium]|nr:TldD/PmbA family protein [Acidimicrobiia bacterium]
MTEPSLPRLADLAGMVLDRVRAATSGRAEAEVMVDATTVSFTRFANSFIHQNVSDNATTLRLRLHLDGRTATGSTTKVTDEALAALAERTVGASRLLPVDPGWAGLAPSAALASGGNIDHATAAAAPTQRARIVADFVEATKGLEAAGFCQSTHSLAAFANSAGQAIEGGYTDATLDGIARTGSADGSARRSAVRLADLDGAALGEKAAHKARTGSNPVEIAPGEFEVVLEPSAVTDLMTWLAYGGFNGKAVAEGRSFVRIGEQQFDPVITMIDDVGSGAGIGVPFDVEGTPKHPTVLVSGGVCQTIVHDRRTARKVGAESTGHAIPGGESIGAFPLNLGLEPGAAGSTIEELIGGVGRGLLVTEFNYTNVLDPRSVVVTGLTRNGLWLIEDGQVTDAVQNLRFTQSYPAALAPGAVLGVSAARETVP